MEIDNLDIAASIGSDEPGETETWNMSLYDQLTSLEGRINRLRYLLLHILSLIGAFVYAVIIGIVTFWLPEPIWTIVSTLLFLPIFYISYALVVKRLQDTGRGEGWITYAQIGVVLSIIYALTPLGSEIELYLGCFSILVLLPLTITCLFFSGDPHPNAYGPDPLG